MKPGIWAQKTGETQDKGAGGQVKPRIRAQKAARTKAQEGRRNPESGRRRPPGQRRRRAGETQNLGAEGRQDKGAGGQAKPRIRVQEGK